MTDGSYKLVSSSPWPYPAKVFWDRSAGGDHSAVTNINGQFVSKWNRYPLMVHAPNYSPFGTSYKFYVKAPPVISGSNAVCVGNPKGFSATNWASCYSWDKSSNLSLSSTTSSSTTVSANGSGYGGGWVYVKNGSEIMASFYVTVGPAFPSQTFQGSSFVSCSSIPVTLTPPNSPGIISYTWKLSNSPCNANFIDDYGLTAKVYFQERGSFNVQAFANNGCAVSPTFTHQWVFTVNSGSCNTCSPAPSAAYPNPVNDLLTIEINADVAYAQLPVNASLIFDVRLYDAQGNLLRQQQAKGGAVQFNVSALPDGIYYLHIYDGVSETPEIQQIMVEH